MDRKASIVNSESSHDKRTAAEYKSKHSGPRQSIAPPSVQRGRRLSVQLSRKSSQDLLAVPKIKLQNTYRIEPEEDEKFRPYKIEPIIKDILKAHLDDKTYEHSKTERLTKDLTREILNKTKQNNISQRYKIVSHVAIGELKGQDIRVTSRCLWDTDKDNTISVTYKNSSLYAVATVFAVYFE